jgi:hypothetical protein
VPHWKRSSEEHDGGPGTVDAAASAARALKAKGQKQKPVVIATGSLSRAAYVCGLACGF